MKISKLERQARQANVESAMSMNKLGGVDLSEESKQVFKKYVEGELEYEDLLQIFLDKASNL